jgi:hypothetical protein
MATLGHFPQNPFKGLELLFLGPSSKKMFMIKKDYFFAQVQITQFFKYFYF